MLATAVPASGVPGLTYWAWFVGVLASLATAPAMALPPRVDINRRGEAGYLDAARAAPIAPGRYAFGIWANYVYSDGEQSARVSPVGVGIGLPFGLEVALGFSSTSAFDPQDLSPGVQLHTTVKGTLWSRRRSPWLLATAFRATNLIGPPDLSALLLLDAHLDAFTATVSGGFRLPTSTPEHGEVPLGLAAEYWVGERLGLVAEWTGAIRLDGATRSRIAAATRVPLVGSLQLVLGLTAGLGAAADFRATLGIAYRPTPSATDDSDGDRIPDVSDQCPDDPEDKDGFEDADGCPDLDNDQDGLPDTQDTTPNGVTRSTLHTGPVRLRMHIPVAPIPTWIMRPGRQGPRQ